MGRATTRRSPHETNPRRTRPLPTAERHLRRLPARRRQTPLPDRRVKLGEARRQRDLLASQAHTGEFPAPTNRLTFAELAGTWLEGFEALVSAGERGER